MRIKFDCQELLSYPRKTLVGIEPGFSAPQEDANAAIFLTLLSFAMKTSRQNNRFLYISGITPTTFARSATFLENFRDSLSYLFHTFPLLYNIGNMFYLPRLSLTS
jgi:hypothetical protein